MKNKVRHDGKKEFIGVSRPWGMVEGILLGFSIGCLLSGWVIFHWLVK